MKDFVGEAKKPTRSVRTCGADGVLIVSTADSLCEAFSFRRSHTLTNTLKSSRIL